MVAGGETRNAQRFFLLAVKVPIKLLSDRIIAVAEYVSGSTFLLGGRTYTSSCALCMI